jgi:hypothetical protein
MSDFRFDAVEQVPRETTIDGKVVISCAPHTFLKLVSPWVGESGSQSFATFSVNTIAYFDMLVFFCATGCWKSRPGKAYKNFVYDQDAYNAVYDQHSFETEFKFKFENPDKRFDLYHTNNADNLSQDF